jgi:hypothetical protein
MIPLISSCTVGKLGLCQLPRFWWKVTLWSRGALDPEYPHCSDGLDRWVLEFLGLDKEETIDRIASGAMTYEDLEALVLEMSVSALDPESIRGFNQRIWFRRFDKADPGYGSRKIDETFGDIGLDPEAEIESAVVLNCVQDWSLWSKRDPGDAVAMSMPPLISFRDYGPSGLQVLPRIWLKHRAEMDADGGEEVEATILDRFDLSRADVADTIKARRPGFLEFEDWVIGRRDSRTVGHTIVELNRRVADIGSVLQAIEAAAWRVAHATLSNG